MTMGNSSFIATPLFLESLIGSPRIRGIAPGEAKEASRYFVSAFHSPRGDGLRKHHAYRCWTVPIGERASCEASQSRPLRWVTPTSFDSHDRFDGGWIAFAIPQTADGFRQ